MNIPQNLKYTKSHEWVEFITDNSAKIGLTDFAQQSLGELVFVNLPEVGDSLNAGEALGDVESVKAVSDVDSPFTGVVLAVNEELMDNPGRINDDPYASWLAEAGEISGQEELLDAAAYEVFCKEEG